MAVLWIKEIYNKSISTSFKFRFKNGGRRAKLPGVKIVNNEVTYAPGEEAVLDDDIEISFPAGMEVKNIRDCDIPWGDVTKDASDRLLLTLAQGIPARFAVIGGNLWDWMTIAEQKAGSYRKRFSRAAGSQGDAPGTNHSGWSVTHTKEGTFELKRLWIDPPANVKDDVFREDPSDPVLEILNSQDLVTVRKKQ